MVGLTAAVAGLFILISLIAPPIWALIGYCTVLFCYPQYVAVPLGSVDFTTSRLVIVFLVARTILRSNLRQTFKFNLLDFAVLLTWLGQLLAFSNTLQFIKALEKMSGTAFDTLLPYFAFRLIVRDKADLIKLLKALALIGGYLAVMGVIQSVTLTSPYNMFRTYDAWRSFDTAMSVDISAYMRHGFLRADGSFGNYIGFGMFFAFLAPLILSLFFQRVWPKPLVLAAFGLLCGGVGSSLSSGPLFSLGSALFMISLFPMRRLWRVGLALFILVCVGLEFSAKCHFYELPMRYAFNAQTAAYRIGLYEEAFGFGAYKNAYGKGTPGYGMTGHWLFGYGNVGIHPSCDNSNFFWEHKDFTSIYIGRLATTGLSGLVPLIFMMAVFFRRLYRLGHQPLAPPDFWIVWCLFSAMFGWCVGTLTVALVAQTLQQFYLMIAMINNLPGILQNQAQDEFVLVPVPLTLRERRRLAWQRVRARADATP